jgi:hypothetical protein
MSVRFWEKGSLFAIEPLCDGGKLVLELHVIADDSNTSGGTQARHPLPQVACDAGWKVARIHVNLLFL